jgi:hypothetical protein
MPILPLLMLHVGCTLAARWLHATFDEPFGHERTERYFQDIMTSGS